MTVAGQVRLRLEHREVDTRSVLPWLDPSVPDDRIIAAALQLQSDHPAGVVILVTSDINLQNKADAVGLPYVEPPTQATPPALRAVTVITERVDEAIHMVGSFSSGAAQPSAASAGALTCRL